MNQSKEGMMDLLTNAFGIHERALAVRSQRMEVLARNIANADTPNYKAEELDFKAMLKETQTRIHRCDA
jgi:flagellar basal-body rod protein FlgB